MYTYLLVINVYKIQNERALYVSVYICIYVCVYTYVYV